MASEVGVLPIDPENVKAKGRLQPGRMFLVDFEQGRLIPDEELKNEFANRRPYAEWLQKQRIELQRPAAPDKQPHGFDAETLLARMQAFGYTIETMQFMLLPLVQREARPGRLDGQRLGAGVPLATSRGCCTTISSSSSRR